MSDGGWISEGQGRGEVKPLRDADAYFREYIPPSYKRNTTKSWFFPTPQEVVEDVEAVGGQCDILVDQILSFYESIGAIEYTGWIKKILVGALIMHVRNDDNCRSKWDSMREAAEQAACVWAEQRMMEIISNDAFVTQAPSLIRFLLERRDHRFSKAGTPVDQGEADAINEYNDKIYGKKKKSGD